MYNFIMFKETIVNHNAYELDPHLKLSLHGENALNMVFINIIFEQFSSVRDHTLILTQFF